MQNTNPSDIEEAEWRKGILSRLQGKDVLVGFYGEASEEIGEERKAKFIAHRIEKMMADGYKGIYYGDEIELAVAERKTRIFDNTVDDIVSKMVTGVMKGLGEKDKERALSFDDFLFLTLARKDKVISREAFGYLLKNDETRVAFVEDEFSIHINKRSMESVGGSGMDTISEVFFEIFRKDGESRESVSIPTPEELIRLNI